MPRTQSSSSIPYTAAPVQLIISDLALWFRITFVLPPAGLFSIIFPIGPFNSGALDELYPSVANLWTLTVQLVFLIVQAAFLLSLVPCAFGVAPPWISGYTPAWLAYVLGVVLGTRWLSTQILNGRGKLEYSSTMGVPADGGTPFKNERWIFVNGVAAGRHWMQSNLDRLSLTFQREIYGIHNETRGVLFDLVECVLERTLGWATPSTRTVYARLLDVVSDDTYERVILILHSQGAIEGGLALDWLFATVPASLLGRVEVYTFGAAANHFNNPSFRTLDESGNPMHMEPDQDGRILRYVEHYANDMDYVSQFGILNFRPRPGRLTGRLDLIVDQEAQNMFAGRLFIRKGYGHQLNNNYLDNLFKLNDDRTRVDENNSFMNAVFDEVLLDSSDIVAVPDANSATRSKSNSTNTRGTPQKPRKFSSLTRRIKDVSRLWEYRNGGVPDDEDIKDGTGSQVASEESGLTDDVDAKGSARQRRFAKGYESDVEDDETDTKSMGKKGRISPLRQLN